MKQIEKQYEYVWSRAQLDGAMHANYKREGVANVGMRPTVNGKQPVLEAHLFDLDCDLYGQLLSVEFKAFIRPEKKFEGLEKLKQQIENDIKQVRNYFLTGAL